MARSSSAAQIRNARNVMTSQHSLTTISAIMLAVACSGPEEPPTVELAVYADPSAIDTVTNDVGYEVELTEARMVMDGLQFAIAGEAHAVSLWQKVANFLVPSANAHPGHYQGGEVTGQMRGRYLVDWLPGKKTKLGTATLIVGDYHSANFNFETATTTDDDLESDDELVGHTALLRGTATKQGASVAFTILIDSPEGRQLVGAPFDTAVGQDANLRLGLELATKDPLEGNTLFDGLDFAALDTDADGQLVLQEAGADEAAVDAYNNFRRTFQTHDHFAIKTSKK